MIKIRTQVLQNGYALVFDVVKHEPRNIVSLRESLLKFLGSLFTPVCFFQQPIAMDIKPRQSGLLRSSAGIASFPLHTDVCWTKYPPDYVAIYCVDYGTKGDGLQYICDSHRVLGSFQQTSLRSC